MLILDKILRVWEHLKIISFKFLSSLRQPYKVPKKKITNDLLVTKSNYYRSVLALLCSQQYLIIYFSFLKYSKPEFSHLICLLPLCHLSPLSFMAIFLPGLLSVLIFFKLSFSLLFHMARWLYLFSWLSIKKYI